MYVACSLYLAIFLAEHLTHQAGQVKAHNGSKPAIEAEEYRSEAVTVELQTLPSPCSTIQNMAQERTLQHLTVVAQRQAVVHEKRPA